MVLKGSPADFLELAGEKLQSLAVDFKGVDSDDRGWVAETVCGFRSLTRLELANIHKFLEDQFARISTLPLQELVLINCKLAPIRLFERGALPKLLRLHIEDNVLSWWRDNKIGANAGYKHVGAEKNPCRWWHAHTQAAKALPAFRSELIY